MELDEVFDSVQAVIEQSIGKPKEEIQLESTLFKELDVDSIDMVDILYELELLYDIELKISDIELRAKSELGDIPYEINGEITKEGLSVIKKVMSEIDANLLVEGLTIHQLVQLFSVHSLCKMVMHKLETIEIIEE